MIEFEEYKVKLNDLEPKLGELRASLNIDGANEELERLHAMAEAPGFWDDPEKSQKIMVKTKQLESKCARFAKMQTQWEDLYTICEMALEEND